MVDNVSFHVEEGDIFGFIGPNGAGKSTTIKMLLQIIYPSAGTASIFGKALGSEAAKLEIGFLPENPYFYDYLTARQFLQFHGELARLSGAKLQRRISEVLDLTGMQGTDNIRLRNFSKGMLQRIGLSQAILHDPKLIILDEPMTGLDPVGRKDVRDLILQLKERGKTIFFSTHILSDVESICNRVGIMNKAKLISLGAIDDLISVETKEADLLWKSSEEKFQTWLNSLEAQTSRQGDNFFVTIRALENESPEEFDGRLAKLVREGLKMGGSLHSLDRKQESLEDVFVREVGILESRV